MQEYHPDKVAHLGAELQQLDFVGRRDEARATINAWVKRSTAGMIDVLVPAGLLDEQTRLVLTDAVYFKGTWQTAFSRRETRELPFSLAGGGRVKLPLMHLTASLRYRAGRGFQALELPYRGGRVSMIVLLPRKIAATREVERLLEPRRLEGLLRSMPRRMVEVYLPRFTASHDLPLTALLQAFGVKEAFGPRADFSGIDGTRLLFLKEVLHRARVEVNEEGTEAAAATAFFAEEAEGESRPDPPVFRADRPFVYLIRERRSGVVLFVGRLTRPAGEALPAAAPDRLRLRPRTMD